MEWPKAEFIYVAKTVAANMNNGKARYGSDYAGPLYG